MEFKPYKDQRDVVQLTIEGAGVELAPEDEKWLIFAIDGFPKLSGNNAAANWHITFGHINEFFGLIDKKTKTELVQMFIHFHKEIFEYSKNISADDIPNFTLKLGEYLRAMDARTDILGQLYQFVLDGHVMTEVDGDGQAGSNPHHTESLTWKREHGNCLAAMILYSKMLCPIFGIMFRYFETALGSAKWPATIRPVHLYNLLLASLEARWPDILEKFRYYIEHHISSGIRGGQQVFTGVTAHSTIRKKLGELMIRSFANIDMAKPGNNPLKFFVPSLHKAMTNTQGKLQFQVRFNTRFGSGDGEDNTSALEMDSTVSDLPLYIPVAIRATIPLTADRFMEAHEFDKKTVMEAWEWYCHHPFHVQFLARSLAAGTFGPYIGGGAGIEYLDFEQMSLLITCMQTLCYIRGYTTLGHLLTAQCSGEVHASLDQEKTCLRTSVGGSEFYRQAISRYSTISSKVFRRSITRMIEEVTARDHLANTATCFWDMMQTDEQNGKIIPTDTTLSRQICAYICDYT